MFPLDAPHGDAARLQRALRALDGSEQPPDVFRRLCVAPVSKQPAFRRLQRAGDFWVDLTGVGWPLQSRHLYMAPYAHVR